MDASHGFCAQAGVRQCVVGLNSAAVFQLVVELLQVEGAQLGEGNRADVGLDVVPNEALVLVPCGFPEEGWDE